MPAEALVVAKQQQATMMDRVVGSSGRRGIAAWCGIGGIVILRIKVSGVFGFANSQYSNYAGRLGNFLSLLLFIHILVFTVN